MFISEAEYMQLLTKALHLASPETRRAMESNRTLADQCVAALWLRNRLQAQGYSKDDITQRLRLLAKSAANGTCNPWGVAHWLAHDFTGAVTSAATSRPTMVAPEVFHRALVRACTRALNQPFLRDPAMLVAATAIEWLWEQARTMRVPVDPLTTALVLRCEQDQDPWQAAFSILALLWAGAEFHDEMRGPRGRPFNLCFAILFHEPHEGICAHPTHGNITWSCDGHPRVLRGAEVAAALGQPERVDIPNEFRDDIPAEVRDKGHFEVQRQALWFVGKLCKCRNENEWLWVHIREYQAQDKTLVGSVANYTIYSDHGLECGDTVRIAVDQVVDVTDPIHSHSPEARNSSCN